MFFWYTEVTTAYYWSNSVEISHGAHYQSCTGFGGMFEGNRLAASSLMCILKKWWRARGKSGRSHRNESIQQTAILPSVNSLAASDLPPQSQNSSGLLSSATHSAHTSSKQSKLAQHRKGNKNKSFDATSPTVSANNNDRRFSSSQKRNANKKVGTAISVGV